MMGFNSRNMYSCLQKCNKLNKSRHVRELLNSIIVGFINIISCVLTKLYFSKVNHCEALGSCDRASWNVGWRELNQQDATNPMFIIKLISQHVSGIIMPIIRRIRPCITAYGVVHCLCWLWLCAAGSLAVCTV